MRLALAQINTTVGDFGGNCAKIVAAVERARSAGADIVLLPEMATTGYPPEDLLLKPDFVEAAMRALPTIASASVGLTAVVGAVYRDAGLYNAAVVCHDGKLAGVYRKQLLPNYGVFDEARYFRPGGQKLVFTRSRAVFGVSVCEDIWVADAPPREQAAEGGAKLLLNVSASPYHRGKGAEREQMLRSRAKDYGAFVAYCNLVGGQDELVFDGHSLVCDPAGNVIARGKQFAEQLLVVDIDVPASWPGGRFERIALGDISAPAKLAAPAEPAISPPLDPVAEVYQALVLGTRDYVLKNGFASVALGLSGGVDSSLTAVIAADAIGPKRVLGVAMPTRYSSAHSLEDAELLARNIGCRYEVLPIDSIFQSFLDATAKLFSARPPDVTEENLQPRIRGTLLMAISNKFGNLVLTTGNKSEVGVGYSTLYGDTAGGFAVIKDVPKTLVYELCRYRNRIAGSDLIPQRVLDKAPSAELRPDQKDSDSLPEYPLLDPILEAYVERSMSQEQIVAMGFDAETVSRVIRLIDRSEYKRRQSPPGIKITPRAFGKDWRVPITNAYRK